MVETLADRLDGYFHFFGVKGARLMQLGRNDEARAAFGEAIARAGSAAEAAHIRVHLDRLEEESKSVVGRPKAEAELRRPVSRRSRSR